MSSFRKDHVIVLREVEHRVISSSTEGDVLLENVATGERLMHQEFTLLEAYAAGNLLTDTQVRPSKPIRDRNIGASVGLPGISPAARDETRRRIDYINKLESLYASGEHMLTRSQHAGFSFSRAPSDAAATR